uniref:Uncharacterized protein n=1 Tax=Pseudo-nitzschia australis TaxID=44445 RepID=A0A7S4ALZ3_9STRA
MSSTDFYKNGFRHATLRHISAKNPIPKDERIALCHYHPEVRPYLFWPKNTPSGQKYAIPLVLAIQLGYDIEVAKCRGLNTDKYCYALPTYSFEDAQQEIGSMQKAFCDRLQQIETNPAQFVRDLRQLEEDVQEVDKLRKRNTELLSKLDDRRRSIKRLRSVLKVQQRHNATKEVQQHQHQQVQQTFAAGQVTDAPAQVGPSDAINGGHQQQRREQYQQFYPTGATTVYHQQQHQLADPSQQQQQQTAPVPQPLGLQNHQQHNQFFQPTPLTQIQQTIGMVAVGINQSNEHQQQEQDQQQQQQQPHHHHWAFTQQYQAHPMGGLSGSDHEQQQQQTLQQIQEPPIHTFDPASNHDPQQQQPVPSPIEETNNPGNGFSSISYAHQFLETTMVAGFKDDQEGLVAAVEDDPHHHHQQQLNQHCNHPPHSIVVGDVVDVDDLDDYDNHPNLDGGFGGDISKDEDLKDDDCSDTERYRQSLSGPPSQSSQRPRKWPRKKRVIHPPSRSDEAKNGTNESTKNATVKRSDNTNRNNNANCTGGGSRKKAKTTKPTTSKTVRVDGT